MTKSVNYFLSYLMVASCAVRAFGKTCSLASGSNCRVNYHIVAKCGNYFLSYESLVTNLAVRSCGETCSLASRSYCCICNLGMTGSGNSLCVCITATASECLNTLCLAGGSCCYFSDVIVNVADRRNDTCFVLAASAANAVLFAVLFLCGLYVCDPFAPSVTECFTLCLTTYGAGLGSYAICLYPSVTESLALCLATYGAGLRSIAICLYPSVTESLALCLATYGAGLRSIAICLYPSVTKSFYHFLSNYVVASCAMLACGKTCFGTCRSNCRIYNYIVTESLALCLTYGANTGSYAICAYPSVIFLNCCGLRLSCLIPSHIIAITSNEFGYVVALLVAILACAAEDKTLDTYGNLDLINVVTFYSLRNRINEIYAGPSCVIAVFAIPVEEVYCRPRPVIFEVNSYCILEIKLAAYCAKTALVYVIAKLGIFGINKTALAVLALQASCRLCVFTYVRNRNCNVNSGAVECNNNDASVFSNGVFLVLTGISNVPAVVTGNLEHIRAGLNVFIYLGPYAVSVGHIVSYVSNVPLGAEMSACTCYCEGSRLSTCCTDVLGVEAGVSGGNCYNRFAIKTYLIFSTCCFRTAILVRTFGNGKFNLNVNCSALKCDDNCTAFYVNLVGLISAGISSTPIVVTYNLECIRACRNVLVYLSVYAVSIGHIVSCVACIPLCTEMLT